MPATVFVPRPKVESALVAIVRRDRRRRRRPRRAVRAGAHRRSASAARCCAARSPASSTPEQFAAAGIAPDGPGRGARRRRRGCRLDRGASSAHDRERRARRCRPGQADAVAAHHRRPRPTATTCIDAEMVTLDLADDADDRPRTATASRSTGPYRRRRAASTTRTSSPGRCALAGRTRRACTSTSGSRTAAGSAAARPTPPPCCAGPASTTSTCAARLGADVPFCLRRRPGPGARHRRGRRAAARSSAASFTLVIPPLHVSHAGRLPGLGRPRRPDRATAPNDLEPAALAVEPRLAAWRDRIGELTGRDAGARRQRRDVVRARASRARRPRQPCASEGAGHRDRPTTGAVSDGRIGETAERCAVLLAALVARAPQHLLVLLLAHALAALLDQRTHTGGQATGRSGEMRNQVRSRLGTSSTSPSGVVQSAGQLTFGSVNRGSIPPPER